jgi:glycosyltransferase involved in cell wall biosynthesis
MKLIVGTNMWSHHQLPVATELAKLLGFEHFKLALFEEVHDERRNMGWKEKKQLPWVIGPPRTSAERQALIQECLDADVMVVGACPPDVMASRIATGKLTFIASERMLKKPFHGLRMLNPRYAKGIRRYRSMVNHPHVHALAIGYYAADDLQMIGAFADQIWSWGYFVDLPVTLLPPPPKRPLKLLWVGRMLNWKRVDLLLKAVDKLKSSGCIGECLIVGDGPEKKRLTALARKLSLDPNVVRFSLSVPFPEVRRLMREADVYVLTSNRHEGWGAVAGEAMGEGCVLVANDQTGAAKVLIQHGETGLLFNDGDVERLSGQLRHLAEDYPLRMCIRQQAWNQMQTLWSPPVAAKRLVALCEGLLGHSELSSFNSGPCTNMIKTST